jgi:hypothetical protein
MKPLRFLTWKSLYVFAFIVMLMHITTGTHSHLNTLQWALNFLKSSLCLLTSSQSYEVTQVFLDEVNTCNSMGLFKEIICDKSINGVRLPSTLNIIAACNPYRLKKGLGKDQENMAGLVFDHAAPTEENVGTGIRDPLKDLVYRVHPLPESMIDYVFDFGALAPKTEKLYIKAMLRRQLAAYVQGGEEKEVDGAMAASAAAAAGGRGHARRQGPEAAEAEMFQQMQMLMGDESMRRVFEQEQAAARRDMAAAADGGRGADKEQAEALRVQRAQELVQKLAQQAAATDREDQMAMLAQLEDKLLQKDKGKKRSAFGEFVDVFSELICAAQEFVRELHGGERSVVSLRDVARCIKVYRWFGEHFAGASQERVPWTMQSFFSVEKEAQIGVRQAVIMALSYCFMARMPGDDRRAFRTHISDTWTRLQTVLERPAYQAPAWGASFGWFMNYSQPEYGPRCTWLELEDPRAFQTVVFDVQKQFVKHLKISDGIALNEALLENLFMILVSILNRIPIFIIGKPGSSKSLAMELVQSNLNGEASESAFLKTLPAVEVFSYQCSPLSTSEGIQAAFETAARYKREAPNSCVVVLLDEVGLAEQSPHLPLKVLHKVLDEDKGGSVVGISNWQLDPAKMNRAVHLYRPAPTVEDLGNTAEGMVKTASLRGCGNKTKSHNGGVQTCISRQMAGQLNNST